MLAECPSIGQYDQIVLLGLPALHPVPPCHVPKGP